MNLGEVKINRIKAANKNQFNFLEEVFDPSTLHSRVPRLESVQEARVAKKNLLTEMRELGKYKEAQLRYVANIDVSIWSAVLAIFAKHDEETGELMDDGLLYKFDPEKGCLVLNRDFFFALLDGPLKGYDYRGRHKPITV